MRVSISLLVVFMLFMIHFELKNCNCLKYRAILPVNENKQKHSNYSYTEENHPSSYRFIDIYAVKFTIRGHES